MDTNAIKREVVQSDMMKIFLAVVSIFTFLLVVKVYFTLNGEKPHEWVEKIYPYLAISQRGGTTLKHIWVLLTQMFIEASVMNLFSNFLWLWLFGFILEDLRGKNNVLPLYVFAGFMCGLVVFICSLINPASFKMDFYFGMRNSVIAVAAAAVWSNPTYKVFQFFNGGFSVWILGIVFLLLNLSTVGSFDVANCLAIIAAIAIGISYHKVFKDAIDKIILGGQRLFTNKASNKLSFTKAKSDTTKAFMVKDVSEKKLNEILEKISEKGMESLTQQEREWLKSLKEKK